MIKKILENRAGFTLIEMIVSVSVFSITMVAVTGIFLSVTESQRSAIASQNVQESMRYVFEAVSKEVRMTGQATTSCDAWLDSINNAGEVLEGATFNTENIVFNKGSFSDNDFLYFKNQYDQCTAYFYADNMMNICRNVETVADPVCANITPSNIKITNLYINILDNKIGVFANQQPLVTLAIDAEMGSGKEQHKEPIKLQTSISGRTYGF